MGGRDGKRFWPRGWFKAPLTQQTASALRAATVYWATPLACLPALKGHAMVTAARPFDIFWVPSTACQKRANAANSCGIRSKRGCRSLFKLALAERKESRRTARHAAP